MNLLCKIGLHRWKYKTLSWFPFLSYQITRYCERCERIERDDCFIQGSIFPPVYKKITGVQQPVNTKGEHGR